MAYPYTQEENTEQITLEKLKEWEVIPTDEPEAVVPIFSLIRFLRAEPFYRRVDVLRELKELKEKVSDLEKRVGEKRTLTKVDYVYELHREELEKEHFGKVIAIDTELKEIVGIGNTVLEAYNNAQKKTDKDQFDFRRVGYEYIEKV